MQTITFMNILTDFDMGGTIASTIFDHYGAALFVDKDGNGVAINLVEDTETEPMANIFKAHEANSLHEYIRFNEETEHFEFLCARHYCNGLPVEEEWDDSMIPFWSHGDWRMFFYDSCADESQVVYWNLNTKKVYQSGLGTYSPFAEQEYLDAP